ncbi:TPA: DUF551 domain-containing protein [Enterobacter hormaechei]|nr:DUF551 domain-containing protein [Enterobacter hormaechei]
MSTLTKEWLQQTIAELEEERDAVPGAVNEDAAMALAAMKLALASLEAEPVAEVCEGFTLRYVGHGPAPISGVRVGDRLYTAPPAPVVSGEYGDAYQGAREDLAIWKRRALEAEKEVQRLSDINDYLVKEAQGEARMGEPVIREPLYAAPLAPASEPDLKPVGFMFVSDDGAVSYSPADWPIKGFNLIGQIYGDLNACPVAVFHGAEHVMTAYKLPDDFDFDRFNDVVWLEAVASNSHMHSPITSTIAMVALELNKRLEAGNSPVIPDGWVACSERIPETMVSVLVTGTWFHHAVAFWDGLSWCDLDFEQPVTHWMPLPAAPRQETK